MEKLRIVFMGTPEFAVHILKSVIETGYDVVGVITAPDRPAGRGQKIKYSAVKEYALQNDLNLLQPVSLKDVQFLSELKSLQASLQIIVAFRMLPKLVWGMPSLGTFNLHASLLPDYRGAAPINWAIINGEAKTGVTTFFIDDAIDTGAVILKEAIEITPDENAGQLHDKLMDLGSKVVIDTIRLIETGNALTVIQEKKPDLKTAYKLDKDNCRIDWNKSVGEIYNLIRGLSPYPAAWCFFNDGDRQWNVKIYSAEKIMEANQHENGRIISTKKELKVAVANGYVKILILQFPGKTKMESAQALNGLNLTEHAYCS